MVIREDHTVSARLSLVIGFGQTTDDNTSKTSYCLAIFEGAQ
jgi:hypothetical protein